MRAPHEQSGNGRIIFKLNSIVDEQSIDALYRASQAGVQVDVWVRGICALRPGVEGLSDNIPVPLDRWAASSSTPACSGSTTAASRSVSIGSADMMHRNLDRRVEALLRVTEPQHVAEITALLEKGTADSTSRWELGRGRSMDPPPPRRRGGAARPTSRPP